MSVFGAVPQELASNGQKMIGHAQSFQDNVKKLYVTIDNLVHSNYTSPDAIQLANEIGQYRPQMDRMAKIINDYGEYLISFAGNVVNNQQENIDRIHIN